MSALDISCKAIHNEHQRRVDAYFDATALDWSTIYSQESVYAVIHQQRQALVLALVDGLHLPSRSEVLDIGCGTGLISVALARHGYRVHAADTVDRMLNLTRRRAADSGVAHRVTAALADINHLTYASNHFSLVLAIGVLPWLTSVYRPICEIARVTKDDGYLIANIDNQWRLNEILDPRLNPVHASMRRMLRRLRRNQQRPDTQRCSKKAFDDILNNAGYVKLEGITLGFGPFSLFGHELLSESIGTRVHNALQHLADRNTPLLRSTGAQYIVLAKKKTLR